jgi:hypothetical protein
MNQGLAHRCPGKEDGETLSVAPRVPEIFPCFYQLPCAQSTNSPVFWRHGTFLTFSNEEKGTREVSRECEK